MWASQNNVRKMLIHPWAVRKKTPTMKFWISLKKHRAIQLAIAVNKKGEVTPPYFMLVFQQECISAFENDVLVWDGAWGFRGKLIWVVQRNKWIVLRNWASCSSHSSSSLECGSLFLGWVQALSTFGEGGCVGWVRNSGLPAKTSQCLERLWISPAPCFVFCWCLATYLIHFVFSERKSSMCEFYLTVVWGWEQNILTPLCSLYGVMVARLN